MPSNIVTRPRRASSKALLRKSVSPHALRAATSAEKHKMGYYGKAKIFISKNVKRITKRTASISERQQDKKQTGLVREVASKARTLGGLDYKTPQARENAAKTRNKSSGDTFASKFLRRVQDDAVRGKRLTNFDNKNHKRGRNGFKVRVETAVEALDDRAKRLRGEYIPDGRYQMMMDYSGHYDDPHYQLMRGSPDVKGLRQITK